MSMRWLVSVALSTFRGCVSWPRLSWESGQGSWPTSDTFVAGRECSPWPGSDAYPNPAGSSTSVTWPVCLAIASATWLSTTESSFALQCGLYFLGDGPGQLICQLLVMILSCLRCMSRPQALQMAALSSPFPCLWLWAETWEASE